MVGPLQQLGMAALGQQQGPLMGPQDPRSQYLAQALQAMGQRPQGSPMGLAANLGATALDDLALRRRTQQQLAAPPTPVGMDPSILQGLW